MNVNRGRLNFYKDDDVMKVFNNRGSQKRFKNFERMNFFTNFNTGWPKKQFKSFCAKESSGLKYSHWDKISPGSRYPIRWVEVSPIGWAKVSPIMWAKVSPPCGSRHFLPCGSRYPPYWNLDHSEGWGIPWPTGWEMPCPGDTLSHTLGDTLGAL